MCGTGRRWVRDWQLHTLLLTMWSIKAWQLSTFVISNIQVFYSIDLGPRLIQPYRHSVNLTNTFRYTYAWNKLANAFNGNWEGARKVVGKSCGQHGHGRVITSHRIQWMWLHIHAITWVNLFKSPIEVMAWMSNYIPQTTMGVITYSCHHLS